MDEEIMQVINTLLPKSEYRLVHHGLNQRFLNCLNVEVLLSPTRENIAFQKKTMSKKIELKNDIHLYLIWSIDKHVPKPCQK